MYEPAVIDLGADFAPVEWAPPPPPVWWRRAWALAGYTALVLLLLGPPSPVQDGPLVPVVSIPAGGAIAYELSSNTLYAAWFAYRAPTFGTAQPEATRATLDAYRLSDGMLRWRVLLPVALRSLVIRPAGPDTVVVSSLDVAATGDRTVAYDALSGRLLWDSRLPMLPTVRPQDTVVLGAYLDAYDEPSSSPYVESPAPGAAPALLMQGLQPRTGAVAWSHRVAPGDVTAVPSASPYASGDGTAYAVTVSPDGAATSFDLRRGVVAGTGRVAPGGTLTVSGRWLLSADRVAGALQLASYRADTLAPAWRGPARSVDLMVTACGELTCLTDRQGTQAVDLATGRVGWDRPAWQPVAMVGGWLYAVPQDGRGGAVLAPATGAPLLDLADWAPVTDGDGTSRYLVSAERPGNGYGAAWLGVLRDSAGQPRVELVGPLGSAVAGCSAVLPFVVCGTGGQQLWVWRLRG